MFWSPIACSSAPSSAPFPSSSSGSPPSSPRLSTKTSLPSTSLHLSTRQFLRQSSPLFLQLHSPCTSQNEIQSFHTVSHFLSPLSSPFFTFTFLRYNERRTSLVLSVLASLPFTFFNILLRSLVLAAILAMQVLRELLKKNCEKAARLTA